jgi:hypothetical protein
LEALKGRKGVEGEGVLQILLVKKKKRKKRTRHRRENSWGRRFADWKVASHGVRL